MDLPFYAYAQGIAVLKTKKLPPPFFELKIHIETSGNKKAELNNELPFLRQLAHLLFKKRPITFNPPSRKVWLYRGNSICFMAPTHPTKTDGLVNMENEVVKIILFYLNGYKWSKR